MKMVRERYVIDGTFLCRRPAGAVFCAREILKWMDRRLGEEKKLMSTAGKLGNAEAENYCPDIRVLVPGDIMGDWKPVNITLEKWGGREVGFRPEMGERHRRAGEDPAGKRFRKILLPLYAHLKKAEIIRMPAGLGWEHLTELPDAEGLNWKNRAKRRPGEREIRDDAREQAMKRREREILAKWKLVSEGYYLMMDENLQEGLSFFLKVTEKAEDRKRVVVGTFHEGGEGRPAGVRFTGRITEPERRVLMKHARALISASGHADIGPLEMLAFGKPSFVKDAEKIRVVFGDSVIYLDPSAESYPDPETMLVSFRAEDQTVSQVLLKNSWVRIVGHWWENLMEKL